jgi:hypothetical protein
VGNKEPNGEGKGGSFKRETANSRPAQPTGACAEFDRYGSIGHCIESVLQSGAFISFSRTRDGGTSLIRVLDGNDKLSSYCHSHGEIMEAMEALEQLYKRKGLTLLPIEKASEP